MKKIKDWRVGDRTSFWVVGCAFKQKGTVQALDLGLKATVRTSDGKDYFIHPNDLVPLISAATIRKKLPEVLSEYPRIIRQHGDDVQFIELTPDIKRRLGR